MKQDESIDKDEVLKMARQVGLEKILWRVDLAVIQAFAKLVAAASASKEREACAKLCDNHQYVHPYHDLGTLIRARGEPTSRGEA